MTMRKPKCWEAIFGKSPPGELGGPLLGFVPVGLPAGYGERRRLSSAERIAKRRRNKDQRLARAANRR